MAIAVPAVPAASQDTTRQTAVTAGVNVRFLSGSFGSDQTTSLLYAPAVLRVETGRFEIGGSFPYLTIHDGTVAPSGGGFVPMRGTLAGAPETGMSMGNNPGGTMSGSSSGMMGGSSSGMMGGWTTGSSVTPGLATNQSGLGTSSPAWGIG